MSLALRLILSLSLFSLCGFTVADTGEKDTVYKSVDEKGNVIFSDKPMPGSKPVDVKPNVVEVEGDAVLGRGHINNRPPEKVDKPAEEPKKPPKKHFPYH